MVLDIAQLEKSFVAKVALEELVQPSSHLVALVEPLEVARKLSLGLFRVQNLRFVLPRLVRIVDLTEV